MAKNDRDDSYYNIYNEELNMEVKECLTEYIKEISSLIILDGRPVKEVKKAKEKLLEALENLPKKPEKVYDVDAFEEALESGTIML